ncbi:hypothetical protein [Rubellicoccus peritrichatus]|uniref:Four helix bundle protein n=1 Tax=Rubellicoccus peritrichatus TaxID=3080537 RepID=A0AAQ3L635_9BACT|nr:hypothetical protein [Puniceicoccus sp. CR14]WOO39950.1 hypothetical protein RZN69_15090 [Puniceicoccus sp. CR14]
MSEDSNNIEDLRNRTNDLVVSVLRSLGDVKACPAGATLVQEAVISAGQTQLFFRRACNVKSKEEFHERLPMVQEAAERTAYWLNLIAETEMIPHAKTDTPLALARETMSALTAAKVTRKLRSKRSSR